MRIASFRRGGVASYGVVDGSRIADVGAALKARFATLRDVLAAGALDELRAARTGAPHYALAEVRFLPVVPNPDKIVCSGVNYRLHIEESHVAIPTHPILFTRFANTLVGHGEPLVKPRASDQLDWEGEMAAVIGTAGRAIPERDSLRHVAGYACFIDASVRDFQGHSFTAGKNFFATGGFGPWLVTADEISDPQTLAIETRLNGQVMQASPTSAMIFTVAQLVAYISIVTPLAPGDVIVTGTPGGVGVARNPPIFMKPGDTVEIAIAKIGTLRHGIVAES
jgi:2-keto-4-pentenoate hydratase/2-oxohepta-3-ene-1,7-dioic acid hydratase in catechol pathway